MTWVENRRVTRNPRKKRPRHRRKKRLRLLDDELGNTRLEDFVEPSAPLALLDANMQLSGNLCEIADERLAVGLDNILSDPLAGRAHHVDRRALRMVVSDSMRCLKPRSSTRRHAGWRRLGTTQRSRTSCTLSSLMSKQPGF